MNIGTSPNPNRSSQTVIERSITITATLIIHFQSRSQFSRNTSGYSLPI